jgi:hypothetical protein
MQTHIISVPLPVVSHAIEKYKDEQEAQISAIDVYFGPVVFDLFLGLMPVTEDESRTMKGITMFYLRFAYKNETSAHSLVTAEYLAMLERNEAPDVILATYKMMLLATEYALANAPSHVSEDIQEQLTPGAQQRIDQHWKSKEE